MVAHNPRAADGPVFTDGPHPTFDALIARKGLNAKHLIANDKRRRTLRATALGQSVIPGLFDKVRVEAAKRDRPHAVDRAARVRVEAAKRDRPHAVDRAARVRAAGAAEHERMYLAQCVDDRFRAAEYFALFDRLNHLVHVPVAFPAPCDLGEELEEVEA